MEYAEYVEILSREIDGRQEKLLMVTKAKSRFPDLRVLKDRWGKLFFISQQANIEVDKVSFASGCGCCSDAPIYAYMYFEFDGFAIYSDPYRICIGENNIAGYGVIKNQWWEKEMHNNDIPEEIIIKTKQHLDRNPPIEFEDDE